MPSRDSLERCGLLVAVPLTRTRFFSDLEDPRKDFVRRWVAAYPGYAPARLWPAYERIARYGLGVAEEARRAGVSVVIDATLESWRAATRGQDVITLVAHCVSDPCTAIEYADAVYPLETVVEALPPAFDGLLDLTVCHSTRAIPAIKRARPRASVVANREPARLDVRLALYRQVVRLRQREHTDYLEAARRVHLAALEHL